MRYEARVLVKGNTVAEIGPVAAFAWGRAIGLETEAVKLVNRVLNYRVLMMILVT